MDQLRERGGRRKMEGRRQTDAEVHIEILAETMTHADRDINEVRGTVLY